MLYRTLFPRDLFSELERIQRQMQGFDSSPSIRGLGNGGFPAVNVGSTEGSVEVFAFAPGIDPAGLDVSLERGVLSISGERASSLPSAGEKTAVHMDERFSGRFRRVVSLPDDIDPDAVSASYRDGVLHISVKRRQAVQPRRINVQ